MTTNQKTLAVLKSLKTRGWKFKYCVCCCLHPMPDALTPEADQFRLDNIIYELPTIPEAERVIDKMADIWEFKKFVDDCYYYNCYMDRTRDIRNFKYFPAPYSDDKRLLIAFELILKLAEAEPDKFKEIWK